MANSILDPLIAAAEVAGSVNKFKAITLLNTDFQQLNSFDITFYPTVFSSVGLTNSLIDNSLTTLFVKNVQGIQFPELEYIDINGIKHVTGIIAPDEVTFEFRESEAGTVRAFLQRWSNLIYSPSKKSGIIGKGGSFSPNNINTDNHSYYYVFNSDQTISKKNALIVLKGSLGTPSIGGWILLEGLKLKTSTGFEFEQDSEDILEISVTMSVDTIKFVSPLSVI